ncbi:hypothetical protein BDI4_830008 [Burkholderia diffusa]|uniref:hypothetical protein n=1 Tax=Burkholderia diffusa TaxID=488732 RepID=UPI001CB0DF9F|nr:hypothetical protein [Burkholderia diffusa]CAG9264239.1 hypothetical protein BDI4_830008 [Burkholderia diffusa]
MTATLLIIVLGVCCMYIARQFRIGKLYGVSVVFALACALGIAGAVWHWPFVVRATASALIIATAIGGGLMLRKQGFFKSTQ